jgi:hypothetical protein
MIPYSDAEKIAEASEFLRNGGDEQKAAAFLQCRVEDLPTLLNLPSKPAQQQSTELDLWAADKLQEVL